MEPVPQGSASGDSAMWEFLVLGPELWEGAPGRRHERHVSSPASGPLSAAAPGISIGHSLTLWPQFPYQDSIRTLQLGKPSLQLRLQQRAEPGG